MFICCPEKEAKKRCNKLGDLKQLVEAIEEKMMVPCTMVCPICGPPCAITLPCPPEEPKEPPGPPIPPNVMVCYKSERHDKKKNGRTVKKTNALKRTKRAKSRELRASILYQGCDCEKRNGLQDDCRRTGCHGSPECLTKPEPICGPSEFSNGKHLGKKSGGYVSSSGEVVDAGDDEGNEKVSVYYNCYPAAIKC
ncbi:uncharacterized protein LOC107398615 [Tribolium castaneum]|uniref:Uncharacterized protein n=1 Tax=Tribolium castaneum TaxID=7070 RepID=D6X0N3_TRICA|nr:PREDICTED: uncharacterized protein LOC107398615 [Tribolium castaneum]EFA10004.1 hypothetical protein TcasGA2_TC012174 [Tribolium castaneum]|eukprot:XP_015838754.1 PREDICTED: uncharacterized protein LOC107398615 [Tribolium castaneum]